MKDEMRKIIASIIDKYLDDNEDEFNTDEIADVLIEARAVFNPETDVRANHKIGDKVWCIVREYFRQPFIIKGKICARKYFDNDIGEKWFEYMISKNKDDCDPYEVQEKYIFATELEAQQAIKDRE